jgi:hypothetical protein
MQVDLFQWIPLHATEQRHVLELDMRVEFAAPKAIGGADGEANKFGAQPSHFSVSRGDGKSGTPPYSGCLLVDPDRSDNLGGLASQSRDRDERDRRPVDLVAIMVREDGLFLDKHLMSEAGGAVQLPAFGCSADQKFRADESGVIHMAHAGILSFS